MSDYISREAAIDALAPFCKNCRFSDEKTNCEPCPYGFRRLSLLELPAADVVEEEDILRFYYVRSLGDYWIGRCVDNFYFAEYDTKSCQWTWTHSRYLPWGEHVVAPDTLWKEHTYPSKPEEIPFGEWLNGFIQKYIADVVRPVVRGEWEPSAKYKGYVSCSCCHDCYVEPEWIERLKWKFCPNCGADMRQKGENT